MAHIRVSLNPLLGSEQMPHLKITYSVEDTLRALGDKTFLLIAIFLLRQRIYPLYDIVAYSKHFTTKEAILFAESS